MDRAYSGQQMRVDCLRYEIDVWNVFSAATGLWEALRALVVKTEGLFLTVASDEEVLSLDRTPSHVSGPPLPCHFVPLLIGRFAAFFCCVVAAPTVAAVVTMMTLLQWMPYQKGDCVCPDSKLGPLLIASVEQSLPLSFDFDQIFCGDWIWTVMPKPAHGSCAGGPAPCTVSPGAC